MNKANFVNMLNLTEKYSKRKFRCKWKSVLSHFGRWYKCLITFDFVTCTGYLILVLVKFLFFNDFFEVAKGEIKYKDMFGLV